MSVPAASGKSPSMDMQNQILQTVAALKSPLRAKEAVERYNAEAIKFQGLFEKYTQTKTYLKADMDKVLQDIPGQHPAYQPRNCYVVLSQETPSNFHLDAPFVVSKPFQTVFYDMFKNEFVVRNRTADDPGLVSTEHAPRLGQLKAATAFVAHLFQIKPEEVPKNADAAALDDRFSKLAFLPEEHPNEDRLKRISQLMGVILDTASTLIKQSAAAQPPATATALATAVPTIAAAPAPVATPAPATASTPAPLNAAAAVKK